MKGFQPEGGCPLRPTALTRWGAVLLALLLLPACREARLPGRPSGVHVLLIGLDGADWDRMEPMMKQGRLPGLAALVKRGAVGKMAVERPPLSPLLWNTVATGRPPDEHGILNFVEYDPKAGRMIPISGRGRRVKALWNMADDAGLKSITLGWWATWPAEQIRGAFVSDRWSYSLVPLPADLRVKGTVAPAVLQADLDRLKVNPESLSAAALRRFLPVKNALFQQLQKEAVAAAGVDPPVNQLKRIVATTESLESATLHLMKNLSPDLVMVYFEGIDEVGHRFARYEAPLMPGVSQAEAELYGGVMDAFYRFQDEVVTRLVQAAGPGTVVILLSDHGFARGGERPMNEPADLSGRAALWHVGPGIVVCAGAPFTRTQLPEVHLVDVVPTVLAVLGLPQAEDLHGGALLGAMDADFLNRHPLETIDSYETVGRRVKRLAAGPRSEDPAAGRQLGKLRSLGYLTAASGGPARPRAATQVNLATVLAAEGRVQAAQAAYHRAIQLDPSSILAHRGLFDLLSGAGLIPSALEAGTSLLALDPGTSSYAAVARFWVSSGQMETGRRVLSRLSSSSQSAGLFLARGLLLQGEGDMPGAEAALRTALQREPGSWDAAEVFFRVMEEQHRLAGAVLLLRKGLAARGGNSVPHLLALGYIALVQGQMEAAGDYLGRAEEEAPEQMEVQLYLGSVHYRRGRFLQAAGAFSKVLKAEPGNVNARRNEILALGRSGRVAQALTLFREAGPRDRERPELLNAAAFACLLNGLNKEAEPLVRRSLQVDPGRPETQDLISSLNGQGRLQVPVPQP